MFFLSISFHSLAEVLNICSRRHVSSLDPARAFDDISHKIISISGLTFFNADGLPSKLIKNYKYDKNTYSLEIDLNSELKWQGNSIYSPKDGFSPNDAILTFNRLLTHKKTLVTNPSNFSPYDMNVGQFINKIERKGSNKINIVFNNPQVDYKKILSHPNSSLISHEYLLFLQRKGLEDKIQLEPLFLKGKSFKRKDANNFSLLFEKDTYNFKLSHTLKNIKDCDIILQLSKNEAENLSKLHKMHLYEGKPREIWLLFNFQVKLNQEIIFRKYVQDMLSNMEVPGELKTFQAQPIKEFNGEKIHILKPEKSSFELKLGSTKIRSLLTRKLSLTYPISNEFFYVGGDSIRKNILNLLNNYQIPTGDLPLKDVSYMESLSGGGYDLALVELQEIRNFISCFKKDLVNHPLHACKNNINAKYLRETIPAIPLFKFQMYHLAKDKEQKWLNE